MIFCIAAAMILCHVHYLQAADHKAAPPGPASPGRFRLVILPDRLSGVFERAIRCTNLLVPDLVISIGDMLNVTGKNPGSNPGAVTGEANRVFRMLRTLKAPFYSVCGNHDQEWPAAAEEFTILYRDLRQ